MPEALNPSLEKILDESFEAHGHLLHIAQLLSQLLDHEIESIESIRETVRQDRQKTHAQFESAQARVSQYLTILANVLKAMDDVTTGIIRNLR